MGQRIGKDDPLWRDTKGRHGGKFGLWNATVALRRESDRLVEALQQAGIKVPTVRNGGSSLDPEEAEDPEEVLTILCRHRNFY